MENTENCAEREDFNKFITECYKHTTVYYIKYYFYTLPTNLLIKLGWCLRSKLCKVIR